VKPAVLVLGATGAIGAAAVRAAIESGWPVVAVARDPQALDALRRQYPRARLQTVAASVMDDAGAAALVAQLQKFTQPFAGVIAALGMGEERGRLLDQSSEQLRRSFDESVLPHLIAARHLLPWLAASGRNCGYVLVGGPGGRNPWAGYGHRSIAAAAIRMLARVLHGEAQAHAVRLQLLEVESPVRTETNEKYACDQWPCVDHIGRKALALLRHRNDARCTGDVIDFRNCDRELLADDDSTHVEAAPGRSSDSQATGTGQRLTLAQDQGPESASRGADANSQEADGDAALLPARCLQDVRKLLAHFASPLSSPKAIPTKKNQERTK
jgi:NADP-dependent 3-hydroxy acid dehydrogenase YdfG